MTNATQPALLRAVSRWQLVGMAVNDVVGSGVYLLPAAAAALLGGASIWAVILAGLAVMMLVLCFAEAASYYDEPGGAYIYTREAFGRFVGFETGWMTWLARIASIASLANGLVLATAYVWPAAAEGIPRILVITLPLLLLGWINVIGVKWGARTAVALTIGKIVPLVFFIVVGFFFIDWSLVGGGRIPTGPALGEAALLLLFAYAGFENTPAAAGEYNNPRRDIPFALMMMILIVTATYVGVQVVALGTLPGLAESESPLAEAAAGFAGSWAAQMMTLAAMVSIFGNIGSTVLIGPRYLFALADDGYGPAAIARVHPTYRTPANAVMVHTAISLILALSGSFVQLALLSIIARLATYIGTAAAVPILRKRYADRDNAYRLPGGPAIPIIALLLSIAFLMSAEMKNLVAGLIALAIGGVVYVTRRKNG